MQKHLFKKIYFVLKFEILKSSKAFQKLIHITEDNLLLNVKAMINSMKLKGIYKSYLYFHESLLLGPAKCCH
jgi:plasmid rolling circle replication initiator protein Rep